MPATNPLTLLVKIYNCLEQTTSKLSFDIQQFSSPKVKQVDITASLATTTILNRDVKTVYFSEPVTGLPKPVFTGYRKAYCVGGIIVIGRSALAISRSLVASRRWWPAFQTHGRRRRETKDSGVSKR